ncbi:MAG: glucosidase [Candidatus Auribacterota bacterium]
MSSSINGELKRLTDANINNVPWKKWGPYLSERQWGTVREDYSESQDAWNYFTHDQARSRVYRWGEDGIAGICEDGMYLCFAVAFWNTKDPIIKERLFGLSNSEGNHGEDVKEYYYYLDNTPTHSYMKYLYKYPQNEFPYEDLVLKNKNRSRNEFEYELIDTGVFDDNRYFDIFIEYAKQDCNDILIKITVCNRGADPAPIHVLPTLWFRNIWQVSELPTNPKLYKMRTPSGYSGVSAEHINLNRMNLYGEGKVPLLFTENETNNQRLFGTPNLSPYVKDGINDFIVADKKDAVNPKQCGTKVSANYSIMVDPGQESVIRLRLTDKIFDFENIHPLDVSFEDIIKERKKEADEFYDLITPKKTTEDERLVMRQALAGMLWTKQCYIYDVDLWLKEHGFKPSVALTSNIRNRKWSHMQAYDVISMPDKWEYPWFAAWDLCFHCSALSMVDGDFAQKQLQLMLSNAYLHPNGQIPAYEWNFDDVNPPVHPWAALNIYRQRKYIKKIFGLDDSDLVDFLKHTFSHLLIGFTWWLNRKDRDGRNIFEGGFLGLDNIGVFDRSSPLPTGGCLEQADATAWMAFFCQEMLQISLELCMYDKMYEDFVLKFFQHFVWIAAATDRIGEHEDEMWDEQDGFFYDIIRFPDGKAERMKVRSIVGLLPLCATSVIPAEVLEKYPDLLKKCRTFITRYPDLFSEITHPGKEGIQGRHMLSMLNDNKLRRVLAKMLDPEEFLSDYGIRSLSKYHREHPFVFKHGNSNYNVTYLPAESDTGMFGGNSNWRGPIWFPINVMIIRSLLTMYKYYGNDFVVECPTGSGKMMNLYEVANEIADRLKKIFLRNEKGERPVFGGNKKFQSDPHWRDNILFYEYFHGDNGAGLGASHQTGWTGIIAKDIQFFNILEEDPEPDISEEQIYSSLNALFKGKKVKLAVSK